MNIQMIRNTRLGGQPLEEGRVLQVPEDLSQQDAQLLMDMGKAVPTTARATPAPPAPEGGQLSEEAMLGLGASDESGEASDAGDGEPASPMTEQMHTPEEGTKKDRKRR